MYSNYMYIITTDFLLDISVVSLSLLLKYVMISSVT